MLILVIPVFSYTISVLSTSSFVLFWCFLSPFKYVEVSPNLKKFFFFFLFFLILLLLLNSQKTSYMLSILFLISQLFPHYFISTVLQLLKISFSQNHWPFKLVVICLSTVEPLTGFIISYIFKFSYP